MKTFAVIGLGRFGAAVAEKLMTLGHSVLAIDESQQLVAQLADRVTRAVVADAREEDVLRSLGVQNVDCAVIAIGSDVAASILVTMLCKELGIGQVVCKAGSREHKRALIKLGADRVIIPEQEMGDKLAQSLISGNVLEQIALSEEYSIAELAAPASWAGKTLRALDIRQSIMSLSSRCGGAMTLRSHQARMRQSPRAIHWSPWARSETWRG